MFREKLSQHFKSYKLRSRNIKKMNWFSVEGGGRERMKKKKEKWKLVCAPSSVTDLKGLRWIYGKDLDIFRTLNQMLGNQMGVWVSHFSNYFSTVVNKRRHFIFGLRGVFFCKKNFLTKHTCIRKEKRHEEKAALLLSTFIKHPFIKFCFRSFKSSEKAFIIIWSI